MVGKILFWYTYFNERKKYIHATWIIGSIVLTKHVSSFISFLPVNVFHPYTAPLITRCVLLQERSKIFLSRRALLDGFDQDEGNWGRLIWTTSTDSVITVPVYFNNSQRQATKDTIATLLRNINDRSHCLRLEKGPRWKERSDLRSWATYQY